MKSAPKQLRDLLSAVLLTLAIFTASQRLYATSWTPGLETSLFLSFLGVLLGLTLGISNYKPRAVVFLSIGYSFLLVPLVTAGSLYKETAWLERILSLGGRLGNSLFLFIHAKPAPDPILFIVLTAIGFWLISLLAGFALTRRGDFIWAVVPAGVMVFIIQLYDSQFTDRIVLLAMYVFFCLLLLGRIYYVRKQTFWKQQHVSISADSWIDLNLAILVSTLFLLLLVWLIPTNEQPILTIRHAWENISRPFKQTRQDLGNAVVGLKGNDRGAATEIYGDTLALGTSASVDNSIYLNVRVPYIQIDSRYYWYVRTYNLYKNNQWQTINSHDKPFSPGEHPLLLADAHGNSDEFIFTTPRLNLAALVTPSHPVWVSRPSYLNFTPSINKSIDPLWFSADPPIKIGEQYTVHANVFNPTQIQLRKAGSNYPSWIRDNYLQLPTNLSSEIARLAQQITSDKVTPFDKATAITEYLRKTIKYSTTIKPGPTGTDPLVWFLFSSQTGYCNYYATAEVIMLRSVGIPARMAVGFAQGEFQSPNLYIVREKDAHAWPEVYFPDLGWVEFEPTASQPLLTQPSGEISTGGQISSPVIDGGPDDRGIVPSHLEGTGTSAVPRKQSNPWLRVLLLFGLTFFIFIALIFAYTSGSLDRLFHRARRIIQLPAPRLVISIYEYFSIPPPDWLARWVYYAGLTPIERSFGIVYQSLRWLGFNPSPDQTPAEAAEALTARLPGAAGEIHLLTNEYEHALFSQLHTEISAARRAGRIIRRQALRLAVRQRKNTFQASIQHLFSRKKNN
jgi:transglutaminase-like putative cysteine protease